VPGTWVLAPQVGYLWTPAWWGWGGGEGFIFHEGYWGPQIGFYGGISYGFGYFGEGYEGGRWEHGRFFYNRSVTNVNLTHIRNVYNTRVVNENRVNRISYNGGNGGINARPTPQQEAAARERHVPPVSTQIRHIQAARGNRQLRASINQGRPPLLPPQSPEHLGAGRWCKQARRERHTIHQPIVPGRNHVAMKRRTIAPGRRMRCTPETFHRRNVGLRQIPAILSWTRGIRGTSRS